MEAAVEFSVIEGVPSSSAGIRWAYGSS